MKSSIKALTGLFCVLWTWSGNAQTNVVSGILTTNTTLSGTNLIIGTVVVTNNVVLTIQPGTQMLMNTNATVIVYGQLLANGTTNEPINITRATTAARSLFGKIVTIGKLRGEPQRLADGSECWVTTHPSALLRMPDERARREGRQLFVADLKRIRKRAEQLAE